MARYNINDLFLEIAINENFEEKVKRLINDGIDINRFKEEKFKF